MWKVFASPCFCLVFEMILSQSLGMQKAWNNLIMVWRFRQGNYTARRNENEETKIDIKWKKLYFSGWKCEKCDLTQNLWLNLTDGKILCGRKFYDGILITVYSCIKCKSPWISNGWSFYWTSKKDILEFENFYHLTGSGGNNHAVDYYKETGYPLCVKLGTITQSEAGSEKFFFQWILRKMMGA